MRILSITTSNVGGLPDCTVALPDGPIAAFAGANGTGKTKLLAATLAPWSQALPSPLGDEPAEVRVEIMLTEQERDAARRLSEAAGWGPADVPDRFTSIMRHEPLVGMRRQADPSLTVLSELFTV